MCLYIIGKHWGSFLNHCTVAQKTVQMFACFGKIELVQNADIIQGPDFFYHKKYDILPSQNILDHVI